MTKRKGERLPRLPTAPGLPATFDAAEEASIVDAVDAWFVRIADKLGSDGGHTAVRDDIYRQLERGADASLPLDYIIDMGDAGHPAADHALRAYIHAAIDADRFAELPLQLRAYNQRSLRRPPAPIGYPSNSPQVVNDFVRDIAIHLLTDQIVLRWPHVPKGYSSRTRHSAAFLLALVFDQHGVKLSERQVRRIYLGRRTLGRRLAEFMIGTLPFGNSKR
jgi:hypothetical protein